MEPGIFHQKATMEPDTSHQGATREPDTSPQEKKKEPNTSPQGTLMVSDISGVWTESSTSHQEATTTQYSDRATEIESDDNRIFFLGAGNLTVFIAHSLAQLPSPPPMTLLFHLEHLIPLWENAGGMIWLKTGIERESSAGFDVEYISPQFAQTPPGRDQEPSEEATPIRNLIVTTKAPQVVDALRAVESRLSSDSTIVFCQSGMGYMDQIEDLFFPELESRPHFIGTTISHGVTHERYFSSTHMGFGSIGLGRILPDTDHEYSSSSDEDDASTLTPRNSLNDLMIIRNLVAAPNLEASTLSPFDLVKAQLVKLAVDCVIHPLTAILGCDIGRVILNPILRPLMDSILSEVSEVIFVLPQSQQHPDRDTIFSKENLKSCAIDVGTRTAMSISPMAEDMKHAVRTEIEYINGFIVKKAEGVGIKCVTNKKLAALVRNEVQMTSHELVLQFKAWSAWSVSQNYGPPPTLPLGR